MKKSIPAIALFVGTVVMLASSGCVNTPVVGPNGQTNIVRTIDPVKLDKVKSTVEPIAASVIRRAIANSPQHSAEIANYVRAVGSVCCRAVASGQVSPDSLLKAADAATQGLQANVSADINKKKNGLLAFYNVMFDYALTVQIPANGWPDAVLQIFCDSIDRALRDSGQTGVK